MKLIVLKKFLDTGVNRLQGTVAEKNLSQVSINANAGQLVITANDRVLAVFSRFPCEIIEPGICFLPARFFSDVVRELPQGNVFLETKESFLLITAGEKSEFQMKIPLMEEGIWKDPEEIIKEEKQDRMIELKTSKLKYMIEQVIFCVSQDASRDYGTVGYLHKSSEKELRFVGTDGYRLSYSEAEFELSQKEFLDKGICLSKRALTEILRMCDEGFDKIQILFAPDQKSIVARVPDYLIFMRLSAVEYPNYGGVFPDSVNSRMNEISISKSYFQSVLRRVLLAADKTYSMQLNFLRNSIIMSACTVGASEGKEEINIKDYQGLECEIKLSGTFLMEILSAIQAENIVLKFKNERDPFLVIPKEEIDGCRSKHVLIPIIENR